MILFGAINLYIERTIIIISFLNSIANKMWPTDETISIVEILCLCAILATANNSPYETEEGSLLLAASIGNL